jgi:hypothetical protein
VDPREEGVELMMVHIAHQHGIDLHLSKPAAKAASMPSITW